MKPQTTTTKSATTPPTVPNNSFFQQHSTSLLPPKRPPNHHEPPQKLNCFLFLATLAENGTPTRPISPNHQNPRPKPPPNNSSTNQLHPRAPPAKKPNNNSQIGELEARDQQLQRAGALSSITGARALYHRNNQQTDTNNFISTKVPRGCFPFEAN
ncbi:hypothetical protein KY290_005256 [Solanum tuberosum]|uniref:Uncharacterized protein n=1 Tax=Solanum tuberosum TaxID=4113 RepID=A0ABQ7WFE7_SOLTU|nr:hypothetical protein KY290_005256 [Solanum tuberosum]